MQTHSDFLRERFGGKNWVLHARRTARIVQRYGDDVLVVTPKRYKAVEREYRVLYGDPHDQVRAELYRALEQARNTLEGICPGNELTRGAIVRANAALAAEQEA